MDKKNNKQAIRHSSRYLAMETLEKIEKQQAYSNLAVNHTIKREQLQRPDANLYTELVYGVTQRRYTLDFFLSSYIKSSKNMENWVRQLLRLSLYQLEYLDRIPEFAIVDEAVKIAKERGHQGTAGLVNAILRNYLRHGHAKISEISDSVEQFSIKYSINKAITGILIAENGEERAEKIARSLLEHPRTSARINRRYTSREAVITSAAEQGIKLEKSKIAQDGLLADNGHLSDLDSFKQGELTIQDESSMLVADAMAIEAHHRVLDACAAPGGKSTHIANFLDAGQGGKLYANDLHPHKVKLIEDNVKRQGFEDVVETEVMDAKKAANYYPGESFDRILVDAPCSGLGLTRRKPDIKYSKTVEDIAHLQKVQLAILESVAPLVKVGGMLTYSTCTITRLENQDVIQAFLSQNQAFSLQKIALKNSEVSVDETGYIAIMPDTYGTDGFFIANLVKNKE